MIKNKFINNGYKGGGIRYSLFLLVFIIIIFQINSSNSRIIKVSLSDEENNNINNNTIFYQLYINNKTCNFYKTNITENNCIDLKVNDGCSYKSVFLNSNRIVINNSSSINNGTQFDYQLYIYSGNGCTTSTSIIASTCRIFDDPTNLDKMIQNDIEFTCPLIYSNNSNSNNNNNTNNNSTDSNDNGSNDSNNNNNILINSTLVYQVFINNSNCSYLIMNVTENNCSSLIPISPDCNYRSIYINPDKINLINNNTVYNNNITIYEDGSCITKSNQFNISCSINNNNNNTSIIQDDLQFTCPIINNSPDNSNNNNSSNNNNVLINSTLSYQVYFNNVNCSYYKANGNENNCIVLMEFSNKCTYKSLYITPDKINIVNNSSNNLTFYNSTIRLFEDNQCSLKNNQFNITCPILYNNTNNIPIKNKDIEVTCPVINSNNSTQTEPPVKIPYFNLEFGQECNFTVLNILENHCSGVINGTGSSGIVRCPYRSVIITNSTLDQNLYTISLFSNNAHCINMSYAYNYTINCSGPKTNLRFLNVTCPYKDSSSNDSDSIGGNNSSSSIDNSSSSDNNSTSSPISFEYPVFKLVNQSYSTNFGSCEIFIQYTFKNTNYQFKSANNSQKVQIETINGQPTVYINYQIIKNIPPNSQHNITFKYLGYEITFKPPLLSCESISGPIYLPLPNSPYLLTYRQYYPIYNKEGNYYSVILATTKPIYHLNRSFKFVSNKNVLIKSYQDYYSSTSNYLICQTKIIYELLKPDNILNFDNSSNYYGKPIIQLEVSYPDYNLQNEYFDFYNPFVYTSSLYDNKTKFSNLTSFNNDQQVNFFFSISRPNSETINEVIYPRISVNQVESNSIFPLYGNRSNSTFYGFFGNSIKQGYNNIELYTYEYSVNSTLYNYTVNPISIIEVNQSLPIIDDGDSNITFEIKNITTYTNSTSVRLLTVSFLLNTTSFPQLYQQAQNQYQIRVKYDSFESTPLDFPYGFINRSFYNSNIWKFSISKIIPIHNKNISRFSVYLKNNDENGFDFIDTAPTTQDIHGSISTDGKLIKFIDIKIPPSNHTADYEPPTLFKVELDQIDGMNAILRIGAYDNSSGISIIKAGDIEFTSSDLTKGNVYEGLFEKYLNYFNLTNINEIYLQDCAGNFKVVPYEVVWPVTEPGSLSNVWFKLINISESSNSSSGYEEEEETPFSDTSSDSDNEEIEDSSEGFIYKVFIKYSSYSKVSLEEKRKFTPGFQLFYNTKTSSLFKSSPSYILLNYNEFNDYYSAEFYLPPNLFNQALQYIIISAGKIYDPSSLSSLIGLNQIILKPPKNNFYDQFPPFIQKISTIPANGTLHFDPNQTVNYFGWDITFADFTNGFQAGNVSITSNLNLIGYQKFFTLEDSEGKLTNIQTPTFSWRFPVTTCREQKFTISSLSLSDLNGHYSSSLFDLPNYFNPIFPFGNLKDLLTNYSININCSKENESIKNDIKPPVLVSFNTFTNSIDVGLLNRTIQIIFSIEDEEPGSGILIDQNPIVYLENLRGEKYSFRSSIMDVLPISKPRHFRINYNVTIDIPFGFGNPEGLLLSIGGIFDNNLNVNGYSGFDGSYIQTTYKPSPIISKASYTSNNPSILTIFGHNLQSQLNDNSNIYVEVDFGYGYIQQPISFKSGLLITVYLTNTTASQFTVKVTVDGIESNKFLVTPFIPDDSNNSKPFECPNKCGGPANGECDNNRGCICNYGFAGPDCRSVPVTLSPPKVDISPTRILETNNRISSSISVVGIREIDESNGEIIKETYFNRADWKFIDKSNVINTYHHTYTYLFEASDGTLTQLNASLRWYDDTESELGVAFADLSYKLNPSTLKYSFRLSKYHFKNTNCVLQLIMDASIESASHNDICSYIETGDDSVGSEYFKLQLNGHALYGRFLKRQLLNSKITNTRNTLGINSTTRTTVPYASRTEVGIFIPYYTIRAELDPDFSIILESSLASTKAIATCTNFGLSKSQIYAIIAAVIIFIVGVVSISMIFVAKKYSHLRIFQCSSKNRIIKSKKMGGKIKMERFK